MGAKRMKVWECDACGRDVIPDNEGPRGYQGGPVVFRDEHGSTGIKHWFACSEDCIVLAVTKSVAASYS